MEVKPSILIERLCNCNDGYLFVNEIIAIIEVLKNSFTDCKTEIKNKQVGWNVKILIMWY